jgi:hypothetical protein
MSFWLNIAWNWHFCPPQREATSTTTNVWKKRIILESSQKLANRLLSVSCIYHSDLSRNVSDWTVSLLFYFYYSSLENAFKAWWKKKCFDVAVYLFFTERSFFSYCFFVFEGDNLLCSPLAASNESRIARYFDRWSTKK